MTQHIYLSACAKDGGIFHGVLENGKLRILDKIPMDSPMYMIIEGDKMHVLLRSPFAENKDSGIVTYAIMEDGSLDAASASTVRSTKGTVGCHLSTLDGAIYAANYVSGSVICIKEEGDTLIRHEGHSVNADRQEAAHCHYIHPTPDGNYLLVCDLGIDGIVTYDKNMNRLSTVSLPAGDGPRHLVFSPDGNYVYCACELSSTCAVFSYHNGILTLLDDITTLPRDYSGKSSPAAIRYANGNVYVSNRGHDSVTVFNIDADGTKLTMCGTIPCGGSCPRDFDIFGDCLICTNEKSDNVTVSRLTGNAEAVQTDEIKNIKGALCVVGLLK